MISSKCKIILIGDSGVGKTSLIKSYLGYEFNKSLPNTIGCEYNSKTINIDGFTIELCIWDTAGQETFRSIVASYFRNVHGVLLVFDLTKKNSFDSIPNWIKTFHEKSNFETDFVLIGNKSDLESSEINQSDIQNLANSHHCEYFETSALNGSNVEAAFSFLAKQIINRLGTKFTEHTTTPTPEPSSRKQCCK
ncbi:Ras- protein Rab-8B [Tritrichomonas musculus]|uniref:Ras- protein Rab-8B n=1 Tax=Tritrichomonas musculus TaxID=1915356 RepID=A0ABR2IM04_9EUKA